MPRSQFANYQSLGLLADANQIGANSASFRGFKPRVKGPSAAAADRSEPHPLELEVPEGKKTIRKVPLGERQVLLALVARHGDDCAAMARDIRLNTFQHTATHLRRRIEKMREEDEEETVGTGEVPQRLLAKRTRDPNNAFKKRSRNFN